MDVIDPSAASPSVPDFILEHESRVASLQRYREACQRCGQRDRFTRRDMRLRSVRVLLKNFVRVFSIILVRWRCAHCHYRFTDYPPFLLPYKRYALTGLIERCQVYLDHDQMSYAKVARTEDRRPVWYVNGQGRELLPARALAPSTIWRWVTFWGLQTIALQKGLQLWLEHDASSPVHRFLGVVGPHKFRSETRGNILRTARRLLHLNNRWNHTFCGSFLPRFATRVRVP
jgi:hypothetical protein